MNIITQLTIFDNSYFGDLEKLNTVLNELPDKELIDRLYKKRGKGRNDYRIESMWRAFIAGFIFEHKTIESLRRELSRNRDLRMICGLETKFKQEGREIKPYAVPSSASFSRFIKSLTKEKKLIKKIFKELVHFLYENLDDFGEILAVDGKMIQSFAKKKNKNTTLDGRRDTDADYTKKNYTYTSKNGEKIKKEIKYFGYRVHLIVDATYEMPVDYRVTKASTSEVTVLKEMIKDSEGYEGCKYLLADRGYDGTPLINLIEHYDITPIIDIKNQWKQEKTKQYKNTDLVYTYNGEVYYINDQLQEIKLAYKGYDSNNDALRYGFHPKYNNKKIFRIKREEDKRIFPKVARTSKKWKRLYNKRTSVERVNGRIDRDFQFENHTIRGLKKMELHVDMSMIIMLAFAKHKIKHHEKVSNIASWVA